ncbi:hypothetical protein ACN47E_001616 [Coniothyrium glycines]
MVDNAALPRPEPALTVREHDGQDLDPAVPVWLPSNLSEAEFRTLLGHGSREQAAYGFVALQNWFRKLQCTLRAQSAETHPYHKRPYKLRQLDVQAVDWFWRGRPGQEDKLGFMKLQAKIETDPYVHKGEQKERADWLPGAVFLRGGSVAMLIIVQSAQAKEVDDEKYVILTIQPRIAAGSLAFTEIPAGMLDGETFRGTAASEIEEEACLKVKESDLINLSALAIGDLSDSDSRAERQSKRRRTAQREDQPENLEAAMYPSPGACDEFIPLFLCQKRLTQQHLDWLKGKATGLRDEGESITLKLVPLHKAWKEMSRDAKGLASLSLYDNLKKEGHIPAMPDEVEAEPEELCIK